MKLSTLLPAAAGALALGYGTTAGAAPASEQGEYVVGATPTSNGPHDLFKRLVKVPRRKAIATSGDRFAMPDAGTSAMRHGAMGDRPRQPTAPKG